MSSQRSGASAASRGRREESILSTMSSSQAFITRTGLQMYLRRNEFFPTDRELEAVFGMFDRDCDGKISYSEFLAFVNPKIKVRTIPLPEKVPFSYEQPSLNQSELKIMHKESSTTK